LPNGERLSIPPNVRIIFEVSDLKFATLATVSRCGMVWFSEDVITTEMLFENYLARLRNLSLEVDAKNTVDDLLSSMTTSKTDVMQSSMMPTSTLEASTMSASINSTSNAVLGSRNMHVQTVCAGAVSDHFSAEGLVSRSLEFALTDVDHVSLRSEFG
jgi:dynein heavy chain 1